MLLKYRFNRHAQRWFWKKKSIVMHTAYLSNYFLTPRNFLKIVITLYRSVNKWKPIRFVFISSIDNKLINNIDFLTVFVCVCVCVKSSHTMKMFNMFSQIKEIVFKNITPFLGDLHINGNTISSRVSIHNIWLV